VQNTDPKKGERKNGKIGKRENQKKSNKRDRNEGKVLKKIFMQINRDVWWVLQVRQLNGISAGRTIGILSPK